MARHRSREHALQLIFQWDLRQIPHEEILKGYYGSLLIREDSVAPPRPDPFAETLFRGVTDNLPAVDEQITKHAEHWRLERMPAVDRNVLRLAVYAQILWGRKRPLRQRGCRRRPPRTHAIIHFWPISSQ